MSAKDSERRVWPDVAVASERNTGIEEETEAGPERLIELLKNTGTMWRKSMAETATRVRSHPRRLVIITVFLFAARLTGYRKHYRHYTWKLDKTETKHYCGSGFSFIEASLAKKPCRRADSGERRRGDGEQTAGGEVRGDLRRTETLEPPVNENLKWWYIIPRHSGLTPATQVRVLSKAVVQDFGMQERIAYHDSDRAGNGAAQWQRE